MKKFIDAISEVFANSYGQENLKRVLRQEKVVFNVENNPNPSEGEWKVGITFDDKGLYREEVQVPKHNYFYPFLSETSWEDSVKTLLEKTHDGLVMVKPRSGVLDLETRGDAWKYVYDIISTHIKEKVVIVGTFKTSTPYALIITESMWYKIFGDDMSLYPVPNKVADYSRSATREFFTCNKENLNVLFIEPEGKGILPDDKLVPNDGTFYLNGKVVPSEHTHKDTQARQWRGVYPFVEDLNLNLNVKGLCNGRESYMLGLDLAIKSGVSVDFDKLPDMILTADTNKAKVKPSNGTVFSMPSEGMRIMNKRGRRDFGRMGVQPLSGIVTPSRDTHTTSYKVRRMFEANGMLDRARILKECCSGNVESIYHAIIESKGSDVLDDNLALATKLMFTIPKITEVNGKPVVLFHRVIPTQQIFETVLAKLNKYLANKVIRCEMGKIKYVSPDVRLDWMEHNYNKSAKAMGKPFIRLVVPDISFRGDEYINAVRSPITAIQNMAGLRPVTYEDYVRGEYTGEGMPMYCNLGTCYVSNSTQRMMQGDFDGDITLFVPVSDNLLWENFPHYVFEDKGQKPGDPPVEREQYREYFSNVLGTILESAGNVGKVDVRRRGMYIYRAIVDRFLTPFESYASGEYCEAATIRALKHPSIPIKKVDRLYDDIYLYGKKQCPFTGVKVPSATADTIDEISILAGVIGDLHHRRSGLDVEEATDVAMLKTFIDKCKVMKGMLGVEGWEDVKERLSKVLPHYDLFEYSSNIEIEFKADQVKYVHETFANVYDRLLSQYSLNNQRIIKQKMSGPITTMLRLYGKRMKELLSLPRGCDERTVGFDKLTKDVKEMRDALIINSGRPEDFALITAAYLGKVCFGERQVYGPDGKVIMEKGKPKVTYVSGGLFWWFCNPVIKYEGVEYDEKVTNILSRVVIVKLAELYQEELEKIVQKRVKQYYGIEAIYHRNPLVDRATEYLQQALQQDLEYRMGSNEETGDEE